MGLLTMLLLTAGMAITLGQFQEVPAAESVRLAGTIGRDFKADHVSVRILLQKSPSAMAISYSSLVDSKFDLSVQNAEMEKVANYAARAYKGREQTWVDEIQVTRSETHGSGCFQQTYVAHFTLPNPMRRTDRSPLPGPTLNPPNR
jgi:hypothetical protein